MVELTLWHKIPALFVIIGGIIGIVTWLGMPIPENTKPSILVLIVVLVMIIWLDDRIYKLEHK